MFDRDTGDPCMLSNWHVLHGASGEIGDVVVQPGPHDDNRVRSNAAGELLRSHLARRAPLCWGSLAEAQKANKDSFFYTNIAPQHEAFNRSNLGGLWGRLENAVFAEVDVEDLKISVVGGPIFGECDPEHRGVKVPREYWKLVAFTDSADGEFKVRAFVLSQRDLVRGIEALELDTFRMFQVSLDRLGDETGMDFSRLDDFDTLAESLGLESASAREGAVREIRSACDLAF